jgi:cytochrome c oxidase assembly protein subunit 15
MPLLYLLLVFQTGIVLTGAAVRITGSGLGSYVPVAGQSEGPFHAWIEFGNRLLTFLLLFAAVAVVIYAIKEARRDLLWRALLQVLGIFGQGIIGGITVLTDLNPLAVASHFILSIFLIAGAVSIVARGRSPLISIRPTEIKVKVLAHAQVLLTFVVIVIGTLVTGSGPHAGDLEAPRLNLDERAISWLHADAVIVLLGVSLALLVLSEISPETKRRVKIFFAATLAQGLIGYAQYVLGLPEFLVIVHVLGSTLVWITSWRIWLSITTAERT